MDYLIGWGNGALYATLTLFASRAALTRWHNDKGHSIHAHVNRTGHYFWWTVGAICMGFLWPFVVPAHSLYHWLWKPINKKEARIAQLKTESSFWYKQIDSYSPNGESKESQTARTVYRALRETLAELQR